jgi:hypothetical protein
MMLDLPMGGITWRASIVTLKEVYLRVAYVMDTPKSRSPELQGIYVRPLCPPRSVQLARSRYTQTIMFTRIEIGR